MKGDPRNYAGGSLLVVDGELPPPALIHELRAAHAPIVAADGAALRLRELSILPDLVIGDLDTIGERAALFEAEGVRVIRLESQETNDLEKALEWIEGEGAESVTIIGAAGGMTDHTLNNFSVLARHARRIRISLRDEASVAYLVHDELTIDARPGDRISLIPLPSAIVTTSGLAWGLHEERLSLGLREGASNHATAENVRIEVSDGLIALWKYGI
jgi:thiamine pyrophosphokinase